MAKKQVVLGLTAGVLFSVAGCGYNDIVRRDEDVKAAWAEVENQYQRRAELVPNLVNTVKGAANFESSTLDKVVTARAKATSIQADASILDNPEKFRQFEGAQRELSGALGRLLAISENYPELRATQAFRDLTIQLEGTENRIAVARKRYIDVVAEYNKIVLVFPTSIGAALRGKKLRPTFQTSIAGADKAPEVKF